MLLLCSKSTRHALQKSLALAPPSFSSTIWMAGCSTVHHKLGDHQSVDLLLDVAGWQANRTRIGIIFHGHYPSSKVWLEVLRIIGRRLAGAHGWTGETFELGQCPYLHLQSYFFSEFYTVFFAF
ncbi:hypothetical protein OCU04_000904 [Sclerotinia nivalis]|uniref:Uncharacterized protein n=1 Tax=Sclerotinia nivalis TaxID=352851 RepID=A0A9X0DQ91_9HELO|nr:hypothetical protein OCU04_000904 [Sclerotinia nivalis]